jgi:hypothetical protein
MRSDEVKFLLSVSRPGDENAGDPPMRKALRTAGAEPELSCWLKEARAFDVVIGRKLEEGMPVPANLRATIMTGARFSQPVRCSWRRAALGGLAAAVLLMVGIAALIFRAGEPLAGWQLAALDLIPCLTSGQIPLDRQSGDIREIQSWLEGANLPAASALPAGLSRLKTIGYKTFLWRNRPVSIVCFQKGEEGFVHLVVIANPSAADGSDNDPPRWIKRGEWLTATWSRGTQTYMVAARFAGNVLKAVL